MTVITKIFQRAQLIKENQEVLSIEFKTIGEDYGFTGTLFRLSNFQLANDEKFPLQSVIFKTCESKEMKDINQEAKFYLSVGQHFANPIFPQIYLSFSSTEDGQIPFYLTIMEDISWGTTESVEDGLCMERLSAVIEDLAEFHAYQIRYPQFVKQFEGLIGSAKDHEYKGEVKRSCDIMIKWLQYFDGEPDLKKLTQQLQENLETCFEDLGSSINLICHSDFTQGNVMVQGDSCAGAKRRSAFIDWQSFFIGNGLIDLSLLLLYGVSVPLFKDYPNLYEDSVKYYHACLIKHGANSLQLDIILKFGHQATLFSFMRLVTGFSDFIMYETEDNLLKQKFRNCVSHCLKSFEFLGIELAEKTKNIPPEVILSQGTHKIKEYRIALSAYINEMHGWELKFDKDQVIASVHNFTGESKWQVTEQEEIMLSQSGLYLGVDKKGDEPQLVVGVQSQWKIQEISIEVRVQNSEVK